MSIKDLRIINKMNDYIEDNVNDKDYIANLYFLVKEELKQWLKQL